VREEPGGKVGMFSFVDLYTFLVICRKISTTEDTSDITRFRIKIELKKCCALLLE
jgi:hypothetical protein